MKEELLKRLLNLVEKTGDRMVITDPEGEHPYVLMGLHQYESIVLSEPQPKNQEAKRDIPIWKAPTPPPPVAPAPPPSVAPQQRPPTARTSAAPPPVKAAPLRQVPPPPRPATSFSNDVARQPRPPIDAEVLEMEGEEQFYLEPLE